jgi:UDP-N-acetylenolpyruvoylglucosamine reductase
MDNYIKLLQIKPPLYKTDYPFNIVSQPQNILFTKKQIELYYIKDYKEDNIKNKNEDNNKIKKGGINIYLF